MEQLGFTFEPKAPPPVEKVVTPVRRERACVSKAQPTEQASKYPLDSVGHLKGLVENREHLIYLYGKNPHLCFVRHHGSDDDGTNYPIMRKKAMPIIEKYYRLHCRHRTGDGDVADVYKRKKMPKGC